MSETLQILLDDTDPAIQYSGNWVADKGSLDNLGNFGAPYMGTSHYIKGTGSFSFTFSGTYVGVFGSSVDGANPSRVCTVDGATIPNNQIGSVVNNIMHCQVDGLANGQHTLVVTVPTANANGYWVDNLLYIPSASVSRANAAIEIEWNDPSMAYGTGWTQSSPGMIATANGASMTVLFTGRSLTWMGYYFSQFPSTATTATYTIDGGSPFSFDLNGNAAQSTGAQLNQRFFTTGILPAGKHTLKVTYNGNSGTTPLSVYSIIVQNGASADNSVGGAIGASHPVSGTSTSGSGGSGAGAGSITTGASVPPLPSTSVVVIGTGASAVTVTVSNTNSTSTMLPVPIGSVTGSSTLSGSGALSSPSGSGTSAGSDAATSSNTASGAATKNQSHLAPILGAVIGALGFILLLLLLVLFLRRRHRKRRELAANPDASRANLVVQPFTQPPSGAAPPPPMSEYLPSSDYSGSSRGGSAYAPVPNSQFYSDVKRPVPGAGDTDEAAAGPVATPWRLQAGGMKPAHQPSQSLSTFSSPATASDATESEVILRHEDSGVRIPMETRPGVTVVEMPPVYSAA